VQHAALRVVRAAETTMATAQTTGMTRRTGIDRGTAGAERIWLGSVTGHAGMDSGPHHHGEAETAVYVLSGQMRFYYGEGYREYRDVGPGDFVFIPPFLPHIERNLSTDQAAEVIIARTPDNIVVNLDDEVLPPR
jgi:uncharacterized RmlC-like cupin family protein